jgi:hypothetical protein
MERRPTTQLKAITKGKVQSVGVELNATRLTLHNPLQIENKCLNQYIGAVLMSSPTWYTPPD